LIVEVVKVVKLAFSIVKKQLQMNKQERTKTNEELLLITEDDILILSLS